MNNFNDIPLQDRDTAFLRGALFNVEKKIAEPGYTAPAWLLDHREEIKGELEKRKSSKPSRPS